MKTAWTSDELTRIGSTDELEIAARRHDGTLHNGVTIWGVRRAEIEGAHVDLATSC